LRNPTFRAGEADGDVVGLVVSRDVVSGTGLASAGLAPSVSTSTASPDNPEDSMRLTTTTKKRSEEKAKKRKLFLRPKLIIVTAMISFWSSL
jgi:hypothetical protein